jgi:hypothetical protein
MRVLMGATFMICSIILLACVNTDPDIDTSDEAVIVPAISATDTITFNNKTSVTVNSGSLNFAGTVSPTPLASVVAGGSDFYTETGIGTVTSFHVTYTAQTGGKACHFDSASFSNTPNPGCTFTKNAQSQGSTFATCTATVTSINNTTCSQSVTFSMQ